MKIFLLIVCSSILEAFPISSSTHVYLLAGILGVDAYVVQTIEYLTHGCYIAVVLIFFKNAWRPILYGFPRSSSYIAKIIVQGFIVEVITLIMYVLIARSKSLTIMALGLCGTTILLYSLRYCKTTHKTWTITNSFFIGFFQGLTVIPGISRLGATYSCARFFGIAPSRAFQLSFLVGLPINVFVFSIGLYRIISLKNTELLHIKIGIFMLIASIGMYQGLRIMSICIQKKTEWKFAWYTATLALSIILIQIIKG